MFCHVALEQGKLAGSREELIHCSLIHSFIKGEKGRGRELAFHESLFCAKQEIIQRLQRKLMMVQEWVV